MVEIGDLKEFSLVFCTLVNYKFVFFFSILFCNFVQYYFVFCQLQLCIFVNYNFVFLSNTIL